MLSTPEYLESISGGGATGTGNCILNVSISKPDEDGTELELGNVIFSSYIMDGEYIVDLTFKDPIMKQRLYVYLESYGSRFVFNSMREDGEQIYFQFAPDSEYWEQYMLAMNPRFWTLTADNVYGDELNTIRLLFDERNVLFSSADDVEEDNAPAWEDTSESF